ncbi:MAG: cation-translocating P-type ATPase [Lachnospiraceae bacterium]|nr:cation-translocating P-type ATPase [Lachnospiraceae bacterium]
MFEQKTVNETAEVLRSNGRDGLSEEEAKIRLDKYGKNQLEEGRKKTILEAFLGQLNDPLICVLFVASGISFLLHEISDAAIILTVIFVNSMIGIIQEGKAKKALDSLKKLTSPKAIVKRDGVEKEIDASRLVPGDVVCLDAGRQVPADLRLMYSAELRVEESSLTGESLPMKKDENFLADKNLPLGDRRNMVYMSTNVTHGRGEGMVTATGMSTEIGKIAAMMNNTKEEMTPLQKRLADLGKLLSVAAVLLCVVLFLIAVLQKRNIIEMFITAISLAVAAVPEGLPAIVTIVLALSVSRMVQVHTIIRRLPSVETLGAVSVVCSDKTGTLTQNKMTVTKCFADFKTMDLKELHLEEHREFIEGMALCNDSILTDQTRIGDPTELALAELAKEYYIDRKELERKQPRLKELAFDSKRKMMTTLHKKNGRYISYTKGGVDEILRGCSHVLVRGAVLPMTERHKQEIKAGAEEMSMKALRVLAAGIRWDSPLPKETGMTFTGLVGMIDPERPEAGRAVEKFKEASVRTVMITGDHMDTAFAIAKRLSIATHLSQCMNGADLDKLNEEQLKERVKEIHVFARVSPEHKVKIVKALKDNGEIVAMTGDGVNDAPSLKAADIGIAMGMSGTDVAKNASDMILADDNFATIERAIEEGRGIYENIKKSILFLLSSNFGEIIMMFFTILCGLAAPLKASHILWINLITDSLPALALGVDKNDGTSLMKRPPRKTTESLFAGGGLACTLFYGVLIATISLVAFLEIPYVTLSMSQEGVTIQGIIEALQSKPILDRAQTYAFTVLGLSQLFHAVGMRNVGCSVFRMNHMENKLMIAAFLIGFLLQFSVTEIPYFIHAFGTVALSPREWGQLIFLSSYPLIAHELFLLHPGSLFSRKERG